MGEEMSHWLDPLISKEQARRAVMFSFKEAIPGFVTVLTKALEADAKRYLDAFSGWPDTIEILPDATNASIVVKRTNYRGDGQAILRLVAEKQAISCEYIGLRAATWHESLEVNDLGLNCRKLAPEYCARELSEKILKPLLFDSSS